LFVAASHDNVYSTMTQDYILSPRRQSLIHNEVKR